MKWVIVGIVASVLGGSVLAFAAVLDVSSAKITVFTNTLVSPAINLSLSEAPITVGESVYAATSLSGASANPGGTVTYTVYSDSGCTLDPVFAGTRTVGTFVPDSDPVEFTSAVSHYWRAAYSGDGNNRPAVSDCVELAVHKALPAMTVSGSGAIVGQPITGTATFLGGYAVTGSVTFNVFMPGDLDCVTPFVPDSGAVSDAGGTFTATSGGFTTAAEGAYRWTASYPGDANNEGASVDCLAAGQSIVTP